MKTNKYHCRYCGAEVEPDYYAEIDSKTISVCDDRRCQDDLHDDIKIHEEESLKEINVCIGPHRSVK